MTRHPKRLSCRGVRLHVHAMAVSSLALSILLGARSASAEESPSAKASRLFREGQDLLKNSSLDEACKRFQESNDTEAAAGTILALAYCDEQHGKKAAAYTKYLSVENGLGGKPDSERVKFAQEHATLLLNDIPHLKLPGLPPDATVTIDGKAVRYTSAGVPIGSGSHEVVVSAPGKLPDRQLIVVGDAETGEKVGQPVQLKDEGGSSGKRTAGFILGGVGVVGLGVGTVFGLKTLSSKSDADSRGCDANHVCPQPIYDGPVADAKRSALISTIGFGVGVVGLGIGAFLVLTSGSKGEAAAGPGARLAPLIGPGSLGVSGSF